MHLFLFLERQQSISTPPTEVLSNPLEMTEGDVQQIEEEHKKIIQKETVQTGSVSSNLFFYCIIKLNSNR
jgi:hypothetical protein